MILQEIMDDIEQRTSASETPRPCEYFQPDQRYQHRRIDYDQAGTTRNGTRLPID